MDDKLEKYAPWALGALATSQLLKEIYNDAASPFMKKVGEALASVVEFGTTAITYPVNLVTQKMKIRMAIHLDSYKKKLEKISEEKIAKVDPEIAQPILERFAYVENKELSEAFVNLLVCASNKDSVVIAHPAFIHIIDRLSPDEIKILKYYSAYRGTGYILPTLKHRLIMEPSLDSDFKYEIRNFKRRWFTEIDTKNEVFLYNKQNTSLYHDNLISLGLVTPHQGDISAKKVTHLINSYEKLYPTNFKLTGRSNLEYFLDYESGHIRLNSFGDLFVKACSIDASGHLPENYDE